MVAKRREDADVSLSETLSRLPKGVRRWTPEQVTRWIRTGQEPARKPTPIPRELRIAVWHRDGGICGLCGEPADPLDWNCDHIVPQALDGPTVIHNLRVAHPRCNRNRTPPMRMTEAEIHDAADEWAANEVWGEAPTVEAWCDAHKDAPAVTDGVWTCRCEMCERLRA